MLITKGIRDSIIHSTIHSANTFSVLFLRECYHPSLEIRHIWFES